MNHIIDLDQQSTQLNSIFQNINEGNTILFLGAGASVGEKRYLSKEIIEYYQDYLGKNYDEPNITKFVDILSADSNFNRLHFDSEVEKMIRHLDVTEGHKVLASLPWQEIITTNYDTIVERSFDAIKNTSDHNFELSPIRELKKFNYRADNTEIKYIKLNGCISDKKEYPLAFSTEDFLRLNKFYKTVLNELKDISSKTMFLSMGYSYSDDFGQQFLKKFDSYNFRERRWIYNVDPFINENTLPYFTQQRICIIKCSFQEFFERYKLWNESNLQHTIKRKRIAFTDSNDHKLALSYKLSVNLDSSIKQLNSNSSERFISDSDFYKGEEPNYNVILKGLDVIKQNDITSSKEKIKNALEEKDGNIIPAFFITGDFGIGKSTFCLRLIHEFIKDADLNLVAFEIIDFLKLKSEYLVDLFNHSKSKNIILYCDEVEVESTFKSALELRRQLSIEQFNDVNIMFIVPIRENIFEKFTRNRNLNRVYNIHLDGKLSHEEASELLDKLRACNLVDFRDYNEKKILLDKIAQDYDNDSFIALLKLVTNGTHSTDLIGAYDQLSKEAQQAFLLTAALHRYQLPTPAGLLKHSISMSWEEFTDQIIKGEGKGLLIQENVHNYGTDPDLYFKTKHPIIAEELMNSILPSQDKQFAIYEKIVKSVTQSTTNSFLINNLLKTLFRYEIFSQPKLDKLHDLAYKNLSDDPHFILNYAINLQERHNEHECKKALDLLIYAESLLEGRNHRFIHRRAVINFELAKIYFAKGNRHSQVLYCIKEAKELFALKQLLDSFSAYSYVDYIRCLIWESENILTDEELTLQNQIQIEDLLNLADRIVTEELPRVQKIRVLYAKSLETITGDSDYYDYLQKMYDKPFLRPYACILLFNHFAKDENSNLNELHSLIEEMDAYMDNYEVTKFLFKYYGRKLYNANNRIKLFKIIRAEPALERDLPLQYNFFQFIAESYDHHFSTGRAFLTHIKNNYLNINPEFQYLWSDNNGEPLVFFGSIFKNTYDKYKAVKISSLQQTFRLIKGNYESFELGEEVKVILHFYLYGIKAEISKIIEHE
jgi:hypothetical protein